MNPISRPKFTVAVLAGVVFLSGICLAGGAEADKLRGNRVGWARLKTPSEYWMRHSRSDPVLMNFFRDNTMLNIDPTWYAADVEKMDQMLAYPVLFSQGIHMVASATGRTNLAEYVRRGGFLLIDACCHRSITPNDDVFLQQQKDLLAKILPEARVVALPPEHPVYRCFFPIPDGKPPHTFYLNAFDAHKASFGLHGIQIGNRIVGIISLSGLQCGWDTSVKPPGHEFPCMRILVNIYIYAMLQGGEQTENQPVGISRPQLLFPGR